MAEQPTQPTQPVSDYRARPLPEDQSVKEQLQTLQPEQRVVVEAKNLFKSLTVQLNGVFFIAATFISLVDMLTGSNLIEPIVRLFTSDPTRVTLILTTITQVYSAANIILRVRTTQPVTLRTDKKE